MLLTWLVHIQGAGRGASRRGWRRVGRLDGGFGPQADIRGGLRGYGPVWRARAPPGRDRSGENLQIFHMLACKGEMGEIQIESLREGGNGDWAEIGFCDWLFGHDTVAEAEEWRAGGGVQKSSAR